MGHRLSKNQRTLASQKNNESRGKERSSKRASALRSSIIIKIRMLKMESKDLTNVKSDQKMKCSSCNDNNGHQSTTNTITTTTPSSHNQYVQPDTQSNIKKNEEIEHLEDRINQINNDNSTSFVARRNQYNRSTNSINNNIINGNEINTDSIGLHDMEGKMSSICDNGLHVTSTESDRIQMELNNIGMNNYKRSNLLMTRGCDNRNITNTVFLSSFIDRNNQCVDNSSIYPNVNNTTTATTSTSKGPDYVPMAPIKSSDKIPSEQILLTKNDSEPANSHKQTGVQSDEGEYENTNFNLKFLNVSIRIEKCSSVETNSQNLNLIFAFSLSQMTTYVPVTVLISKYVNPITKCKKCH